MSKHVFVLSFVEDTLVVYLLYWYSDSNPELCHELAPLAQDDSTNTQVIDSRRILKIPGHTTLLSPLLTIPYTVVLKFFFYVVASCS